MSDPRAKPGLRPLGLVLLATVIGPVQAGAPDPCQPLPPAAVGSEFRLNTLTETGQSVPNVIVDSSGGFLVAWHHGVASLFDEMRGQRVTTDGQRIGGEMDLLDAVEGRAMGMYVHRPALVALANGGFQAAWAGTYWEQTGPSTWTRRDGIVTGRYGADGTLSGDYLAVPLQPIGQPAYPAASPTANGNLAVVWSGAGSADSLGTYRRLFDGNGAPAADVAMLNTTTTDGQFQPRIAAAASGSHAVVWRGNGPGDSQGVFLRRFDASGLPTSGEVRVNVTTSGTQMTPDLAMQRDGRHLVVWQGNGPGDDQGVFARRYNAAGIALGDEIRVNLTTAGYQGAPAVAAMPDGGFVVVWQGNGSGDDSGIFMRRFDEFGAPNALEVAVNTTVAGGQLRPALAIAAGGEIIVVWDGAGVGDTLGVFGQVHARPGNLHRSGFEPVDGACPP